MSVFQTAMLVVMLAVGAISISHPRGLLWLAAVGADYFISSAYWRAGLGSPELASGLCDGLVCLSIILFGQRIWEMRICVLIAASLLVNFLYLAQGLAHLDAVPQDIYSSFLEVLTVTALLSIGGVSAFRRGGYTDGRAFHPWRHIFGFVRPFAIPLEVGEGTRED